MRLNHVGNQFGGAVCFGTATATPETQQENQTKILPPYGVILHNDDVNTMEFVVHVLQKVFGYDLTKAAILMLEVHHAGCSLVFSGSLEHAELKAEQIHSCCPDPNRPGAPPLGVTVEPLPG